MSPEPPPAESSEAARPSASVPKESEPSGTGVATATMPGAAHETNALWVGNLPTHAGEDDVMAAFAPHEALECVVKCAGSRSYAFVFFCSVAESRAALETLLGSKVKCAFIQIEFAQPEEDEEFQKVGKNEGVEFSSDQTSAYIDIENLENSISAHKDLNGTFWGPHDATFLFGV